MPAKKKTAAKSAETDNTVEGYSGSPHEGQGPSKPEKGKWSDSAVHSPAGSTEPTRVFKGDGVTPQEG
jgi:hypothetical protein